MTGVATWLPLPSASCCRGSPGPAAAWSWGSSTSPRTRSPTGAASTPGRPRSPTGCRWPPPAPTTSTSEASRPGRARSACRWTRSCRRVLPVVAELAALGRPRQHRHDPGGGGRGGPRGGRRNGQRRQRRPGGPGDGLRRRRCRCSLGAHAPAGRQPRHVRRGDVRRRRRRRAAGAGRARRRRAVRGRGARPARRRSRPRASPSSPSTTWLCWRAWTASPNWGFPVLVGASRKRFLGALLATADGDPRPTDRRDSATLATSVLAAAGGRLGRAGARRGGHRRCGTRGGRGRCEHTRAEDSGAACASRGIPAG